eukprot:352675-Chlamydomonas_euryale.AAC.5
MVTSAACNTAVLNEWWAACNTARRRAGAWASGRSVELAVLPGRMCGRHAAMAVRCGGNGRGRQRWRRRRRSRERAPAQGETQVHTSGCVSDCVCVTSVIRTSCLCFS